MGEDISEVGGALRRSSRRLLCPAGTEHGPETKCKSPALCVDAGDESGVFPQVLEQKGCQNVGSGKSQRCPVTPTRIREALFLNMRARPLPWTPAPCDYSSSYSMIYKQCQRHNVLVPAGTKARVAAENPCMETISLLGNGDEQSLHVSLNAGKAYRQYYESWTRTIQSRQPNEFVILDEYELKEECGCDGWNFSGIPCCRWRDGRTG